MLINRPEDIRPSEITPRRCYEERREFMKLAAASSLLGAAGLALHRLVYVIAPLGVLHFWWMVKRDITQPAIYAAILAVLLGLRTAWRIRTAGGSERLRTRMTGVAPR